MHLFMHTDKKTAKTAMEEHIMSLSTFTGICRNCLVAGIIALSLITLGVLIWTMLL